MYKVIPDYPMYMANEDGEILSLYNNRKRKAWVGRDGYPRITLWKDGKQYTIEVHRLVASAFLEQPEGRTEVHHRNHDKTDNSLKNLEWVSHKENMDYDFLDETRDPQKAGKVYKYNIYLDGQLVDSVYGLNKVAELTGQHTTSCWKSVVYGKPMASGYLIERTEEVGKKEYGLWKHYSCYKDDKLIASGVSVWDCVKISGYSARSIRYCAQTGRTTPTGWRFERKLEK